MPKHRARGEFELDLRSVHKAIGRVLRIAREQGASVTRTGSGHIQIRYGEHTLHAASTARNPEQEAKRLRSRLRHVGIDA